MKIKRDLMEALKNELSTGNKIILLSEARQTGKTHLSDDILLQLPGRILYINADEIKYHEVLSPRDLRKLALLTKGSDIVLSTRPKEFLI